MSLKTGIPKICLVEIKVFSYINSWRTINYVRNRIHGISFIFTSLWFYKENVIYQPAILVTPSFKKYFMVYSTLKWMYSWTAVQSWHMVWKHVKTDLIEQNRSKASWWHLYQNYVHWSKAWTSSHFWYYRPYRSNAMQSQYCWHQILKMNAIVKCNRTYNFGNLCLFKFDIKTSRHLNMKCRDPLNYCGCQLQVKNFTWRVFS